MNHSIVPASLIVKSMRDNGYKNTAYAIAELIDNSIQHKAEKINLFCLEEDYQLSSLKTVSRIKYICVLDNGDGMSKETLWNALQFGNGTNLNSKDPNSIGKFGMGLPSSSISQATRVDVWSWQNGVDTANHSYLDVLEVSKGIISDVPEPVFKEIPKEWAGILSHAENKGTLVIWSNLDRCLWRTGKTIIDHSEFIVGRMYRKFLYEKKCTISATVIKDSNFRSPVFSKDFRANDPLYLMNDTSVSSILKQQSLPDPMFVKFGGEDGYESRYTIQYKGDKHLVFVRYSIATETARKGRNAGTLSHGKHAGNNIGVSILRAGRELDLDTSWCIGYDPRERWWGIEVEFPATLDEVFGVTNNKQYANNFKELGYLDLNQILDERNQTITEYKEELFEENDLKVLLIDIAKDIKNRLKTIRKDIEAQAKRLEKGPKEERHMESDSEAEEHATKITAARREDGHIGQSDTDDEEKSDNEKLQELIFELKNDNIPEPEDYAKIILENHLKYEFVEGNFESRAFFSVAPTAGKILIKLNVAHPAYHRFVEVLKDDIDPNITKEDAIHRLSEARNGLKFILMAWARFEDEQPAGKRKENVIDVRTDWGKIAGEFMEVEK